MRIIVRESQILWDTLVWSKIVYIMTLRNQFGNVGGYSIVSKPPFIQPDCQMLCYSQDGTIKVIKRAETFDDVFNTFITEKQ